MKVNKNQTMFGGHGVAQHHFFDVMTPTLSWGLLLGQDYFYGMSPPKHHHHDSTAAEMILWNFLVTPAAIFYSPTLFLAEDSSSMLSLLTLEWQFDEEVRSEIQRLGRKPAEAPRKWRLKLMNLFIKADSWNGRQTLVFHLYSYHSNIMLNILNFATLSLLSFLRSIGFKFALYFSCQTCRLTLPPSSWPCWTMMSILQRWTSSHTTKLS